MRRRALAFSGPRGSEAERAESEGEERGASGRRRGIARRGRGSRRWRGRVLGGGALFPSSAYWQEEEDGSALGGLGRYSGGLAPLVATQVRPGKLSLSSVF